MTVLPGKLIIFGLPVVLISTMQEQECIGSILHFFTLMGDE